MFASPAEFQQSASSCSGGSSCQTPFTGTNLKPTLSTSTTQSSDGSDGRAGPALPLADRFQNISQGARILARVAQAQATLHAQGELPGDVDLAAMMHLTQDIAASLRAIQDLKASLRQTPSSCLSSVPSSVQRRRQARTPRRPKRCVECSCTTTPEWRSGPEGPRSLCNVCGLLYAKYLREQRLRAG